MLKKVVLAVGLTAIPSIALAQQQQCQLECTWVNQKGEKTKVTRSCHALNASDCTNLGRAETGGNKTCQGNITSNCVKIAKVYMTMGAALPPKADMCSANWYVRFLPIADIPPFIRSPRRRRRSLLAALRCRALAPFEG